MLLLFCAVLQRDCCVAQSDLHGLRILLVYNKMKRRTADRSVTESVTSKRIVRRKVDRRSPSPDLDTHSKREVRSTALYEDKYDKYDKYSKFENKYEDKFEEKYKYQDERISRSHHSKASDERVGKSFKPRYSVSHEPAVASGGIEFGQQRFLRDKFVYSLRVGNIDFKMPDGELKTALFREFKRFGFINVKVLGFGKERHAFINFSREDDARRARKDMQNALFHNHVLNLEWSKSTLRRFPEILGGSGSRVEDRTGSGSKRRTLAPVEDSYEYRRRGAGSTSGDHFASSSSRNGSRDISYKSSSDTPPHTSSHSRSHGSHHSSSSKVEAKPVVPVIDPSATRTLFVGNLEQDITERELRDLFSPYGRIESVDIKLQRSTGTAYAFVKFLTINDALNAKNDMHGRQYGDYRLKIGFGRGSPSAKVWIGNLSTFADMSEVRHEFDRFGLIRRVDYNSGDSHAFVHFDSLDAAQAAINSMAGYRLRTTGRTLKIDICKPLYMRGEHEEYDPDFHSKVFHSSSDGATSSPRKHHSHSEDFHTESEHYKRQLKDHSTHHFGSNGRSLSSPSSSNRYHRRRSVDDSDTHPDDRVHSNNRNFHRKRPRSHDQYETGGYRQRPEDDDINGDVLYRPKRPRNGLDSHHRLPGDKKLMERDHPTSRGEPMDTTSTADSNKQAPPPDQLETELNDRKTAEQPEHGPTPPIPSDITTVDVVDTALKLTGATEPISPDSDTKSVKPDCTLNPETLADLAKLYPIAWRGNLVLKNTGFPTRMHLVGGDPTVAELLLRSKDGKDDLTALRISQRLRLEPPRLEEVNKRMASAGPSGHCILIAFPGLTPSLSSPDRSSDTIQLRPLKSLVSYLKQKEAAGIVALSTSEGAETVNDTKDTKDIIGVLHAFPPCEFSQIQLLKIAPNLGSEPAKEDHIVVLLVKGTV